MPLTVALTVPFLLFDASDIADAVVPVVPVDTKVVVAVVDVDVIVILVLVIKEEGVPRS